MHSPQHKVYAEVSHQHGQEGQQEDHAKTDEERSTAEAGLQALDRAMNVVFENRRLMTSDIGIPSVGEK